MNRRIKRLRPTYAGVTATLALVLALGMGGAYAAQKLGSSDIARNAVLSKHIKDGQVKTKDLAANATIGSAKTAEHAQAADAATTAESADSAETAQSAISAETADRATNVLAARVQNGCGPGTTTTVNGFTVSPTPEKECNVTFPRNVTGCAIALGPELAFAGGGETTYRQILPNTIQVSRRDSAGGTPTAGAFSITAVCPAA